MLVMESGEQTCIWEFSSQQRCLFLETSHPLSRMSQYTSDLPAGSRGSFDLSSRVWQGGRLPIGSLSLTGNQMSNWAFLASQPILISLLTCPEPAELPETLPSTALDS